MAEQEPCNVCQVALDEFKKRLSVSDVTGNGDSILLNLIESLGQTFDCGPLKMVCYPLIKLVTGIDYSDTFEDWEDDDDLPY